MKGILNGTSVYLSGPIENVGDGSDWRSAISPHLQEMGVKVMNPLEKPAWLRRASKVDGPKQAEQRKILLQGCPEGNYDEIYQTQKEIRDMGIRLAYASDWMICRLPRQETVGTYEEIKIAKECGKPCFFWCPDGLFSMWLFAMFATSESDSWRDIFFDDWESLHDYLKKINACEVPINSMEWIFVTYFLEANQ